MDSKIRHSLANERKVAAAKKVFKVVMKWYAVIQYNNSITKALELAQMREEMANKHNSEDDLYSKY